MLVARPHLRLIALVGIIVPQRLRADWRQEWEAELQHRELLLAEWDRLDWRSKLDLFKRSTSALGDALWLQPKRLEDELMQDLMLGLRMLVKHPAFTSIAVLTLAVGIGANITIFSVVNAVLLRPLPYPNSERLVFLWSEVPKEGVNERASAYATISDWREQNTSFEDLACYDPTSVTLFSSADPEPAMSVRTSANLFRVLGVAPLLGRTFTDEEVQQKARVVVISHRLWLRRFGASSSVLGQTLEIDGGSSQVIGVMPEHFESPETNSAVWEPSSLLPNWEQRLTQRGTGAWQVVGRLKPQVTLQEAQIEMNSIAERLEQAYPNSNKGVGINIVPLHIQLTGRNVRLAIWILLGAVVCLLLIACTNVANLMLARGIAREREMAIRMALGAGRLRLIRQLLTESTMLAMLAGVVGLLLGLAGIRGVLSLSPPNIPYLESVSIDVKVLIFTVVVTLLTGLIFGLAPALKISQSEPGGALKEGRSSTGGIGARRLRGLLVTTQFSLAVLLISGAGLLVRSFMNLQAVDAGFDPTRILVIQTAPPLNTKSDRWRGFYQQVTERIATLPGVESAGLSSEIFISGNPEGVIAIEHGTPDNSGSARIPFRRDEVSENFFQTLRVPLHQGRFFNTQDNDRSLPVAVINETMQRRLWPGQEAVGKRFKVGSAQSNEPWLTVVGVVGDMRRQGLERQPIAQTFRPYEQDPSRRMNLLIRTSGEPTQVAESVRNEIRAIDKTVLVYGVSTLESQFARAVAERRFQTWLLTLFSTVALLLAAIGIYGLLHQSVAQRTREIGTRMALGAERRDILRLIVGQGMSFAILGIGLGCLAAFAVTRILSSLLFGVTPTDAMTFIAAPTLLILVALIACYLPAHHATKVDPISALRNE